MTDITAADLERLTDWDTPTICNGLEVTNPERRALGFTTGVMFCAFPELKPICGYARTATIRAMVAPKRTGAENVASRQAYYEYVAKGGPAPSISVIQDLDSEPGFGAFWGEVNTSIHKGLGALGVITDGSIRDLDASAPGFQLLARKVGPSHAHVHVVDHGGQVNIFGMVVNDGDIVHADRHGAVVIPPEAVKKLPDAIDLLTRREAVILDAARAPDFSFDKLKAAMGQSADIH
ncbi:RraA family protein [Thalassobaculum salexigens]|uniref:RraA family protein n=1 Tax=Thalassobaculum salexigens TaxID=455360 RepID=UPI00040000E2|nr:RraA family protein [Thalassobaculum salexigens]